MSICTLDAARLVVLEHRYIMWLCKLQGPERCNLSSGGLMPSRPGLGRDAQPQTGGVCPGSPLDFGRDS